MSNRFNWQNLWVVVGAWAAVLVSFGSFCLTALTHMDRVRGSYTASDMLLWPVIITLLGNGFAVLFACNFWRGKWWSLGLVISAIHLVPVVLSLIFGHEGLAGILLWLIAASITWIFYSGPVYFRKRKEAHAPGMDAPGFAKFMKLLCVLCLSVPFPCFFLLSAHTSDCRNTLIREVKSPDGTSKAVVFERNCGATTSFNRQVAILPATGKFPKEAALPTVFVVTGQPEVEILWRSDKEMVIRYQRQEWEKVIRQSAETNRIHVVYEPFSPARSNQ